MFFKIMLHHTVSHVQRELVSSTECHAFVCFCLIQLCTVKSGKNRPGPKMRVQLLSQPEVIALNAFIKAIETFGQSRKVM